MSDLFIFIVSFFISSNATLNIFLAVTFRIYAPLSSARHEAIGISFLFSVQIKFSLMPTGLQTLWNSLGLHKMMFSKLAASYTSPVSVSFFIMFRVLGIYLLLCCVVTTYIHHHLRTRDQYLRKKDKSNGERCFRVASRISDNVKRDKSIFWEFKIFF